MIIEFNLLKFMLLDDRIVLVSADKAGAGEDKSLHSFCHICEVHIAGDNRLVQAGAKQFCSSQWDKLKYVSHKVKDNVLTIIQRSQTVEVNSIYQAYDDTNTIRSYTTVKNISDSDIVLEYVSAFNMFGLASVKNSDEIYLYRFTNSHHAECQPKRLSFFDLGLFESNCNRTFKRISGFNTGSWSSKEELPQAIIQNTLNGHFIMFQIESNNSWYWEIGENLNNLYLNLGGGNQKFNQWAKKLKPGEIYCTVNTALAYGNSLNEVVGEMTKYRRHIIRKHEVDENQPVIFNEYMHLSWDSPLQSRTEMLIPQIAELGVEYYVIDCGWHNEEPGNIIYPYVGQWRESKTRFPLGLKHTIDCIKSHGMKAGLWLEPEIIGNLCTEMLKHYPENAYLKRNGKPITELGRLFLDFRCPEVISYLNITIDMLVNKYGVEYLKLDYNQDCGPGTEVNSFSLGDGLEQHCEAYLDWVKSLMDKYPNVIIETCSSGGQRMDYRTLELFSIVSSSDQTNYRKYPYISANISSSVLPVQAAVWSYPVESSNLLCYEPQDDESEQSVNDRVDEEAVIMNMVNAMLGRIHLASRIDKLSNAKKDLIKEGICYYRTLNQVRKEGLPYYPLGFADFMSEIVASGYIYKGTIYLAVWNMKKAKTVTIPLIGYEISGVKVGYPAKVPTSLSFDKNSISINFKKDFSARFLEITVTSIN